MSSKKSFGITLLMLLAVAFHPLALGSISQLPDCTNDRRDRLPPSLDNRLLIVSSLDGKISGLETKTGKELWSYATGPLLSSTISNIEITSRGEWIQLIPSLDGMLYKYNGKVVEPIPVNAETLLRNSYKLGDDMVVTGGKESRTYAINLESGQLRYVCTMNGCDYYGENVSSSEPVLLVRRETQTVRAVEPRSGSERWNFSVGEHHIAFLDAPDQGCRTQDTHKINNVEGVCMDSHCPDNPMLHYPEDFFVKVVVPEGLILAQDSFTGEILWSAQFTSPIVNAWYLSEGEIQAVDMFDWKNLYVPPELEDKSIHDHPVLYMGSHGNQLYIQHSSLMKSKIIGAMHQYLAASSHVVMPQLEWEPELVVTASPHGHDREVEATRSKSSTTAVTFREKIDSSLGHGYYLYKRIIRDKAMSNSSICRPGDAPSDEEDTLDQIIIGSLWHWWKEILAVSVGMSLVSNMLLIRYYRNKRNREFAIGTSNSQPIQIVQPAIISTNIKDASEESAKELPASPSPQPSTGCEYISRFQNDFERIQCLGKGGFGVVIEAKNKIDECSYAIKRICLPSMEEAREKVLREVKALAKLDHPGIVRYYNSWLECPPPGWQEEIDRMWEYSSEVHSATSASTSLKSPAPAPPVNGLNPLKLFDPHNGDSSFGFIPRSCTKNGSFMDMQNSDSSSSFDVVFNESHERGGDHDKRDLAKKARPKPDNLPFERYLKSEKVTSLSSDTESFIAFHDSGCPEKSTELETDCSSSYEPETKASHPVSQSARRPDSLSIPANHSSKLFLYIQMQLCRKETLKDWLNANIDHRERYQVLDIFDQIVSAVQYVHSCGLMHRDLKPSNIFFSVDGTVKVGDFGLVTALTENEAHTPAGKGILSSNRSRHTDRVGTQLYMSPEQISGLPYSHKVDIYSLGLIFFELIVPFHTQMERISVLSKVRQHQFPEEFRKVQPEECKFVSQLLSLNPEKRPSAAEIKQHALFKEFQPKPETIARQFRRRTLSQTFSSSSSDEIL